MNSPELMYLKKNYILGYLPDCISAKDLLQTLKKPKLFVSIKIFYYVLKSTNFSDLLS